MIKRKFMQFQAAAGGAAVIDIGSVMGWYDGSMYISSTDNRPARNEPCLIVTTPGAIFYVATASRQSLEKAVTECSGSIEVAVA